MNQRCEIALNSLFSAKPVSLDGCLPLDSGTLSITIGFGLFPISIRATSRRAFVSNIDASSAAASGGEYFAASSLCRKQFSDEGRRQDADCARLEFDKYEVQSLRDRGRQLAQERFAPF